MNDPLTTVEGSSAYRGLVALMSGYLSVPSVEAMLGVSLEKRGLSADHLQIDDVAEVVAEAMVGLRAFCVPERLPELMLALADYCDHEQDDGSP